MKNKIILSLYALFTITFLLFTRFSPENFYLQLFSKAMLMPLLILFYYTNLQDKITKQATLMTAALFFSWLGDVFLQINLRFEIFFIFGLVAFLTTHILYIIIFLKPKGNYSIIKKRVYLLIPFFFFQFLLMYYLYNDLNNMKIPVIIYSTAIFLMAIVALNRYKKVSVESFMYIFIGACVFIISDSTLAIALFKQKFFLSREITMFTYTLAQFLIVKGYLQELKK